MEEYKNRRIFILNTAGISSVEFFWGLGLPLVFESTFLQLFLNKLGASNLLVGLIPTIFFIGQACLGLVSAYQTRHIEKKRTIVIIFHIFPAVIIIGFGIYLYLTGIFLPSTIVVFFAVYIAFNAGLGFTLPVWQNYLVKLFSPGQVLPAFSVMMILQSAGRLLSSFLIAGFFSAREISAASSSVLFIFCGIVFFIGSFGFFLTKEPDIENDDHSTLAGFTSYVASSFRSILKNKNMLLFLLSDLELYSVIAVISFYANYAVTFFEISAAAAAGLFIGLNYGGQIAANFLFGTMNLFSMRTKCTIGRLCSISGIVLIIVGGPLPVFLAASLLLGLSRAIRSLIYAPAVKMISGKNDVTSYFAASPVLMLPISVGIPIISGWLLDNLPQTGPQSYRIIFAAFALLSFASIFIVRRVNFSHSR